MTEEILSFDTEVGTVKEKRVDPLPLYDENYHLLKKSIPEYKDGFPNEVMENVIKRLKMTRKLYGGIGLSANQCGVLERVFVIGTDDYDLVCVNPKVLEFSENLVKEQEGCLSFPGLALAISRPEWIVAEFTNEKGEVQRMRLDGITARCYLHELEHLDGKRFTDNVGLVTLEKARRKQKKLMKRIIRAK